MEALQIIVAIFILALASSLTFASDPSPLQDFCVAINDPKGSGLHIRKNTSNIFGSTVTPVNVAQMPGLHTLGISMVRIDYAPNGGLNPPHTHPRASEILVVLEGTLHVGFITSNPDNRLIFKVLYPGDVFVFPVGLIHFQYNIGNTYAVAFAGLSSENPGVITIANAVFGSNPSINADILAKAFNLDRKMFYIGKTAAVTFAGLSSQNAGVITIANSVFGSNRPINPDYTKYRSPYLEALQIIVAIFILALASSLTFASDPSPLQDFFVAINDPKGSVFVNGKFCKDAKLAKADEFYFSGLHIRKNTSNIFGSTVTPVNVAQMPGLHTLGISMVRIDYAPNGGLNPPHTHPRASEILVVLEGTLHYNIGNTYAVAFAGLSSENPGGITIANAVFGSNPSINADILAKAFNLDRKMVKNLQSEF
ncbi:hypothetical protein PVK06_049267 [Gossypium arboreum]|uniref:Cupin type-1 domain-containing protein n=1 Tax=Gossypium arboreum TaxID=29729 RepID=A0ABR0MIR8_GOSAR|nr:hypothetical protein PVK06_049267 [Gossypium arboreum]